VRLNDPVELILSVLENVRDLLNRAVERKALERVNLEEIWKREDFENSNVEAKYLDVGNETDSEKDLDPLNIREVSKV
jgi:hypothetical protein